MTINESDIDNVGTCALCDKEKITLKESHSIPKFAYEWIKTTSKTPFLRQIDNINIRHQDGPKEYLLCGSCEKTLSVMEKELAERLFKKVANYRQQTTNVIVTETMRIGILSIFWRAILTTRHRKNSRTDEDNLILEQFLTDIKAQIRDGQCKTKIFITPFFGEPPYYGLPSKMTYELERSIGGQDTRFFDNPHRFFMTFKLPFMYFHIFSNGWSESEILKSSEFLSGELNLDRIKKIPDVLQYYIKNMHSHSEASKSQMNKANLSQIRADAERNKSITGSDKSMERSQL